jgi:hypothetical protein
VAKRRKTAKPEWVSPDVEMSKYFDNSELASKYADRQIVSSKCCRKTQCRATELDPHIK